MADQKFLLTVDQFEELLSLLKRDGYKLMGPTLEKGVINYNPIESVKELPIGWCDKQEPGHYSLEKREDEAYFGYSVGPRGFKDYLFPPREKQLVALKDQGITYRGPQEKGEKRAYVGVRACEIQAIEVQDRVYKSKIATYDQFQAKRENLFILAVNCTRAVSTCFCASMDSGPEVKKGFDLALTEVIDKKEHYFVLEVGSKRGSAYVEKLGLKISEEKKCQVARELIKKNRESMVRSVDNAHVHAMLIKSWNCKRWDQVATRCINCANCTSVCPTCFCSDTQDLVSLDGKEVVRQQSWESCFNLSHSYVHGGSVRKTARARYRQWLTHKFGTWWDQFGLSGCVGCGRCIVWCPVGIDVTEELNALKMELHENNS